MGEEEVQMMKVSTAEAAVTINMEAMFLMRTSFKSMVCNAAAAGLKKLH